MKQFALFFALCFLFTKAPENCADCQDHQYLCAANTMAMNTRLCIDITEVPTYMYKDFMASIAEDKGTESDEFINSKPDFSKWQTLFDDLSTSEIENKFFESDDFALMPIIGISLEQAEQFALWRTKAMEAELAALNLRERKAFPRKFKFRLPTPEEWARVRFLRQEKRMMKQLDRIASGNRSAFKLSKSKVLKDHPTIKDVYSSKHSDVGFFNLFDNVAEMTNEPGKAMGGSWYQENASMNYQQTFEYTEPQAWLGFRCVFEIIN